MMVMISITKGMTLTIIDEIWSESFIDRASTILPTYYSRKLIQIIGKT